MLSRGESGPAHLGGSYGEGNRHTDQLLDGALSTQRPRRPSLNSTCTRSPPRTILRGLLLREVAPTCFLCVAAACCSVRALATRSVCPLFFQGFLLSPRDCSFNTTSSEEKYQKVLYSLMSPGTVFPSRRISPPAQTFDDRLPAGRDHVLCTLIGTRAVIVITRICVSCHREPRPFEPEERPLTQGVRRPVEHADSPGRGGFLPTGFPAPRSLAAVGERTFLPPSRVPC